MAPRLGRVKSSASQRAAKRARDLRAAGRDIISLSAGEPDFPTPAHVIEAATAAMRAGETKYTDRDGSPEVKAAIAEKFRRDNGLDYAPGQIIASSGAKQVIFNALMATLGEGDEVIVPAPHWVSYPDMVRLAGGEPVVVPCAQNNGFRLRAEDLAAAITPATRWFVYNGPNNPTGAVYDAGELTALAEVLADHPHIWVIADDIYEHFLYDGRRFATMAGVSPELAGRTLTVNGVSKAYAMTGWRLGFGGGPAALITAMAKVQGQSTACPSSISQAAAVAALTGPQDIVARQTAIMQGRRDLICQLLNGCPGLSCQPPQGAMYVFCDCAGLLGKRAADGKAIGDDGDVTEYLLDAAGVAVVSGAAYGLSPYFRVSFALDADELRAAGQRIHQACSELQ
ncbi:MAG: pyridoxal phosphate-dependent aminotransferase [Alphaproteobacteria bacterium]|nr:pyridoxal phosphate-dependent aminotransferase [Alphaproteobacteria bacterium]